MIALYSRSSWNGRPSTVMLPGPISSSARSIRPSRPSALSASPTISRLGEAIAERARICRAISISSRCGLSAQAAAKALAQIGHLVHGLTREYQCDDRDQEREENEGVVEHQASRRAHQSVFRRSGYGFG